MIRKQRVFIFLASCALLFCNPQNELIVDGDGIGVKGHVYSIKDSLPLGNVRILLTEFEGTNLQRKYEDATVFSDSVGLFTNEPVLGFKIVGDDTIDCVHRCRAIFTKQGYIDTTFPVDQSDSFYHLKIYMRQ